VESDDQRGRRGQAGGGLTATLDLYVNGTFRQAMFEVFPG